VAINGNQWQSVAISDHRQRLSARQFSDIHLWSEAGKGDDRPRERWLLDHLWGEVMASW